MRNFFSSLLSQFHRGHASFFGSSALVQLFPLLSAPIVARLYTPEDFGIYAVFYALFSILGGVLHLSLNNAALLEAEDEQRFQATVLALGVSSLMALTLWVLVVVTPQPWQAAVLGENVLPYLVWLPVNVWLTACFACLYAWAVKSDRFSLLARNKLILGVSTMVLQIGIGLTDPGAIGFVIANMLGLCLAVTLLALPFVRTARTAGWRPARLPILGLLHKHRNLVIWTTPAALVNYISSFLPDLLINRLFGAAQLGQYSLANRMVNFPLAFAATSLQDIFRQQASTEFDQKGHCRGSFRRFFLLAGLVSLCLIVPILVIVPYVFPIVFGSQWGQAGYLIQATAFLTIVRFISSPLSYVWIIRGQQRLDFFWQIGLLLITLSSFLAPSMVFGITVSLYEMLWIYSLCVGTWYVFCIFVSRRFSQPGSATHIATSSES